MTSASYILRQNIPKVTSICSGYVLESVLKHACISILIHILDIKAPNNSNKPDIKTPEDLAFEGNVSIPEPKVQEINAMFEDLRLPYYI